jgi:AhpD family alkylhydroperoxidase
MTVFDDIKDIRETRKRYNHKMFGSGVPVFRAYEEAEAEALRSGALSGRYKELVALGISITEKCYPCVEYHVTAALKGGATRQEVIEATAVALVLGGGVAQWPARFVFRVLDEVERENAEGSGPASVRE